MISHKPATETWPKIKPRKNGRVFKYPAEPPYLSMTLFNTQAVKILNHTQFIMLNVPVAKPNGWIGHHTKW